MTKSVAVIGAGHNGLIAANLLAQKGYNVTVYEASASVGGGAQTHEFAPGYKTSTLAHLLFHWNPQLSEALQLKNHGLQLAEPLLPSAALAPNGSSIVYNQHELLAGDFSESESVHYREALLRWNVLARWLAKEHRKTPARLGWDRWREAIPAVTMMLRMRLLGRDHLRELLRVATMAIQDVLEEDLSDPRLKGALALDAVLGTNLGTRSGNSFFTFLHRLAGLTNGGYRQVIGGMGGLTDALVRSCEAAGVRLHTDARVVKINLRADRVSGLTLADGRTVHVDGVLSAIDASQMLLSLLGPQALSVEQTHQLRYLRRRGTAAKVHLALNDQPNFPGLSTPYLSSRLVIAPSVEAVDQAFNFIKYQQCSDDLVMELHIPTVLDPGLAPTGHHVISAIVQYVPSEAQDTDQLRAQVLEKTIRQIEQYAPGVRTRIIAQECLLPSDIENRYRCPAGHWHHSEMSIDQALMLRPIPKLAQYRGPVEGLWMCGASTHPGGGIHGQSALLAVDALAKDLKP